MKLKQRILRRIAKQEIESELEQMKDDLAQKAGKQPSMFAYDITNAMLNNGWIAEGVEPSKLENFVTEQILGTIKQVADKGGPYSVIQMDNDFLVVQSPRPLHRIAKFYPWPRQYDASRRAERLAFRLNMLSYGMRR